MSISRYNELRDRILARLSEADASAKTCVAVLPDGFGQYNFDKDDNPVIHIATDVKYSMAEKIIQCVCIELGFEKSQFLVSFTSLNYRWRAPWSLTARTNFYETPLLLAVEQADGSVEGALFYDPIQSRIDVHVASTFPEPEDAVALINLAQQLGKDWCFRGCYKIQDISALSLDAAAAASPKSDSDQLHLLLYRNQEWLGGIWSGIGCSLGPSVSTWSIAAFHGLPSSNAVMDQRPSCEVAKASQVLAGDASVLKRALSALSEPHPPGVSFEACSANRILCDWWNANAPENERHAGFFKVYFWDEASRMFHAGDVEEPAYEATCFGNSSAYFEPCDDILPPTIIQFFRPQQLNPDGEDSWVCFKFADGTGAHEVGFTHRQAVEYGLDEAVRGISGLQKLAEIKKAHLFSRLRD